MVTAVNFYAASGAHGGQPSNTATPRLAFSTFAPGATSIGNRLGFFGIGGAANSPVRIGSYQDRSHVVDYLGNNFGTLINIKFVDVNSAQVSGVPFPNLVNLPGGSGTILCRFTDPDTQLVTTQNATFRCAQLTAVSGVPDITDEPSNINVYALQFIDTCGNAGDSVWTQIAGDGTNSLSLANQSCAQTIHDFEIAVSASPTAAGRKIDFGFVVDLEFL